MSNAGANGDASEPVFIVWKERYSVGNDELDGHHRIIFSMINDLFSALQQETDAFAIDDMLGRLEDYARGHFGREEELMELHQFPGFSAHQEAHRGFVNDLSDLRLQSMQPGGVTVSDLLRFLKRWWVDHISKTDKQYSPYVSHVAVE